ncbi:MAG TPA: hypothetical protein VN648_11435 [Candidatus Methylomirabilis sp.]|nr:hypothetical protein [Candidatus Methylomirabilis sp.]
MESSPNLAPSTRPLLRLVGDIERWGTLFLEVARTREVTAAEQVLGGLVEWMGSDLLEGWLRLPIPLFEEVSDLSEELFQACQAYLAWSRQSPRPVPGEVRSTHEESIRTVLDRVHMLGEKG